MSDIPVDLIIPDSGPLISLARANRLDLVKVFDRLIVIADIVQLECLKKPTAPDHQVLERWFARIGNRARVVETPMREPYEAALHRERAGEARATSGFGDATWPNRGQRRRKAPVTVRTGAHPVHPDLARQPLTRGRDPQRP